MTNSNETVHVLWVRDPEYREGAPFVSMARDHTSVENDPDDWREEIAAAVSDHGHENVRETIVTVNMDAVVRAFEPVVIDKTLVTSGVIGGGILGSGSIPVGTPVKRGAEGYIA